jgi:acetoin:2,6-dichlorophenolindophenol oxidoreductase subunit alpha
VTTTDDAAQTAPTIRNETGLETAALIDALARMLLIRHFEERTRKLFTAGRLPGFVHLYIGEEAVAVGACTALQPGDKITSNHRGHGHVIAKDGDVTRMFAELLGRETGYCHGKGGSMHIVDFAHGMLGTNGIVGGGIPIATGAAFASSFLRTGTIALSFFGDGASNQGVLFESLNLAALWQLPIIFLCENNHWTEWSRTEQLTAGSIVARGTPFGVPGVSVDGNDFVAVYLAVRAAADRARAGEGPTFIEAVTYRWHAHNEGEEAFSGVYRQAEEIASWQQRDPIVRLRDRLITDAVITLDEYRTLEAKEAQRVEDALRDAESAPFPPAEAALTDVFADAGIALAEDRV